MQAYLAPFPLRVHPTANGHRLNYIRQKLIDPRGMYSLVVELIWTCCASNRWNIDQVVFFSGIFPAELWSLQLSFTLRPQLDTSYQQVSHHWNYMILTPSLMMLLFEFMKTCHMASPLDLIFLSCFEIVILPYHSWVLSHLYQPLMRGKSEF